MMAQAEKILGQGVRKIKLVDIAPDCDIITTGRPIYDLYALAHNANVLDIGCGYGRNKKLVESAGGFWVGLELFEGGAEIIRADAQKLPFCDSVFDVVLADAVLEHIPEPGLAFAEISRVLKADGVFVGYAAFMECFHEISYCHLSFKALEYFSKKNKMKLEKISGGCRFGIDYHFSVLWYPLAGSRFIRPLLAACIRSTVFLKSVIAFFALCLMRHYSSKEAIKLSKLYFKIECLRQSTGYSFFIKKKIAGNVTC
ncbi:MAG: class I SAM-dependent methyltransferase [Candidatus Electrothrix sp. ATG2]|nr:class I SAM-dependent methyltransferase [Candidatus Electrothrix sp. ATG2]